MKKWMILMMTAVIGTAAFAEMPEFKVSVLGGGLFQMDIFSLSAKNQMGKGNKDILYFGGGGFLAVDATDAELGISIAGSNSTMGDRGLFGEYSHWYLSSTRVGFSFLGK
jgi:hypothetical protein